MRPGKQAGYRAFAIIVTAVLFAPAAFSTGIDGQWLDEKGDARIEITRCGHAICGHIVWLREPTDPNGSPRRDSENSDSRLRNRLLLGLRILDGAQGPSRRGEWRGGNIYDPANGKTYRCTLRLEDENRLNVRGYVGIRLLGRTSHWTRIPTRKD